MEFPALVLRNFGPFVPGITAGEGAAAAAAEGGEERGVRSVRAGCGQLLCTKKCLAAADIYWPQVRQIERNIGCVNSASGNLGSPFSPTQLNGENLINFKTYGKEKSVCMWLRELHYSYCLPILSGLALVMLSYVLQTFFSSVHICTFCTLISVTYVS